MARKPKKDYSAFVLEGASTFLPIVGGHFRPPALSVMNILQHGQSLYLMREPTNPHDANAIKVVLPGLNDSEDISQCIRDWEALNEVEFLFWEDNEMQLGYVPAPIAAKLAAVMDAQGDDSFAGGGPLFVTWPGAFGQNAEGEFCITNVAELPQG
jgi:hypothetical protein